jgi:glutamine synthetase
MLPDSLDRAQAYHARVLPLMRALRCDIDAAEAVTDASYWPVPSYGDILFYS